ncbi:DNA repair protein RecO [Gammaproteobacteria bacterium]
MSNGYDSSRSGLSVRLAPAYILHRRPYRDTSLLIEAFTARHGRVGLVERGRGRGGAIHQGVVLQPFWPLLLSFSGRGELATLGSCEPDGPPLPLIGGALLCGFYLNELLMRLLPRQAPHTSLFHFYHDALTRLAQHEDEFRVLRLFEVALLRELGYGLLLERDAEKDQPLNPEMRYRYVLDRGPFPTFLEDTCDLAIQGRTLLELGRGELSDATARSEAKRLTRAALALHLGNRPLHSRNLYADYLRLSNNQ